MDNLKGRTLAKVSAVGLAITSALVFLSSFNILSIFSVGIVRQMMEGLSEFAGMMGGDVKFNMTLFLFMLYVSAFAGIFSSGVGVYAMINSAKTDKDSLVQTLSVVSAGAMVFVVILSFINHKFDILPILALVSAGGLWWGIKSS